ncbi:hypothetical protein D6T17_22370 [Salmonella enterica subsp. enterica serovar Oranienburg]|nr:hypothetical protein [Salmonella enterica subsp. enterica serovar Oranienburg]EBY8947024.1 hypothetical protein [Salmonella enterica subsp. enterica serovar Oranienburg]
MTEQLMNKNLWVFMKKLLMLILTSLVSADISAAYLSQGTEVATDFTVEADDHAPTTVFTPVTPLSPSDASGSNAVLGELTITYDIDVTGTYTCLSSDTVTAGQLIMTGDNGVQAMGSFYDANVNRGIMTSAQLNNAASYYSACAPATKSATYIFKHYGNGSMPTGKYSAVVRVTNYTP